MAEVREEIGTGLNLFPAGEVVGEARWFNRPADVLEVDDDEVEGIIAFVARGGVTFMSPILADLAAVVCTAGTAESHLAIVSRECDVPCVMGASLATEVNDGDRIALDLSDGAEGRIHRISGSDGA